jgi:hypothetical protein
MLELMKIAGRNCERDIGYVVSLYTGMWVFLIIAGLFFVLNMSVNFYPMIDPSIHVPNLEGTQIWAICMSLFYGVENAICTITFIAIIVCLFEYAINFTYVCYLYDNKQWETIMLFKRVARDINNRFREANALTPEQKKRKSDMLENIKRLHKPDEL